MEFRNAKGIAISASTSRDLFKSVDRKRRRKWRNDIAYDEISFAIPTNMFLLYNIATLDKTYPRTGFAPAIMVGVEPAPSRN